MKLPRMVIGATPSLLSLVNAQPKNISPKAPPQRLPCRHLNQIDEGLGLNSGQRAAITKCAGDYLQLEPLSAARQMLQDARAIFPLDAIRRQELMRRLQEFYLSNREARPAPLFGRPDLHKASFGELVKAMGTQLGLFSAPPPAANRPPGSGWEAIPKGKKGGYRRRKTTGKGYEYWYQDQPHTIHSRPQKEQEAKKPEPPKAEPAPEEPPKFARGDRVIENGKAAEIWTVGDWDSHLGDRRYQIMDPATRQKTWANGKNISHAPAAAGPPKAEAPAKPPKAEGEKKPVVGTKGEYATTNYTYGSNKELRSLAELYASGEAEANPALAYKLVTRDNVIGKVTPERFADDRENQDPACQLAKYSILSAIGQRPPDKPTARAAYIEACGYLQQTLARCNKASDVATALLELTIEARHNIKPLRIYANADEAAKSGMGEIYGEIMAAGYLYRDSERAQKLKGKASKILGQPVEMYVESNTVVFGTKINNPALETLLIISPKLQKLLNVSVRRSYGSASMYFKSLDRAPIKEILLNTTGWDWAAPKTKAEKPKTGEGADEAQPSAKDPFDILAKVRFSQGNRDRVGPPVTSAGAKPDDLAKAFNMKTIEFGESTVQDERHFHVERAYEALADLAGVLGIDAKQIGANGRLTLSFGSRGKGWGAAHYETATQTINLTRKAGNGSLAHEYGHALDHMLTVVNKIGGGREPFATAGDRNLPQAVAVAMNKVRDAIHTTPPTATDEERQEYRKLFVSLYADAKHRDALWRAAKRAKNPVEQKALNQEYNEALKLYSMGYERYQELKRKISATDSSFVSAAKTLGGPYWVRPHELFARCFEAYVQDKLEARGQINDYLVKSTDRRADLPAGYFPDGEERKRINAAIDELIAAMHADKHFEKSLRAMAGYASDFGFLGENYKGGKR